MNLEDILEELGVEGWSDDGYGLDSNLIHDECGTTIEQDAAACPECGEPNPLRGLI